MGNQSLKDERYSVYLIVQLQTRISSRATTPSTWHDISAVTKVLVPAINMHINFVPDDTVTVIEALF